MSQAHAAIPDSASDKPAVPVDRFSYDDSIVRMFLWATYGWAIVAFLVGLYVALQLPFPQLSFGQEYLTFGRLRPLHTNAAIFAFAGNAIFCAVYYSTPRLCKTPMWSRGLGRFHFWGWQAIIGSAAVTLPLGITQSREYAELEWPIDVAIAVVWVAFAVNFFMTLKNRRERHMYVALWFYIATIVTVAILHIFNNLVVPAGLFKSYSIYAGVQDAFMQWWYGHNAVAFFLTTPFLGLMYYFMPKAAGRPVFSYRLSIIHFWSLVFIYIWAGPHHLHYTALPQWASTLGMIFSVMLWMPSWGGMINGLLTLRGAWHKVTTDPVLKFFVVAVTFYGMATFEGPLLSIKSVNSLSHYTDWTIGHVHAGALGWNGFMAFGLVYWLAPRLFQTKLYSVKLATAHFWIATVGILLYVVSMYVAGVTQGLMWRALTPEGQLAHPDFVETTMRIIPFYWIRAIGGVLFLGGALIGGYNLIRTWQSRPEKYEVEVHEAPPLDRLTVEPEVRPQPQLPAVLETANKLEVFSTLWWHRRWERLPFRFTVWTTIAVATASLLEIIPTFVIRSNVPTIASVQPYTPLELCGRDIYIAEGCYNCHSQMIRPMVAEKLRYGEYSKPGEFVYDHPFQWGSRRIGPDLAREGGKQSTQWHVLHFRAPDELTPHSIMPVYAHLMENELDLTSLPIRMRAMKALGVPYSDEDVENCVANAEKQAREFAEEFVVQNGGEMYANADGEPVDLADRDVIALVAYLQRLGTDLFAEPPGDGEPVVQAESSSGEAVASGEGGQ
ncbi:MAG: cytochrome-c oxidase, cbb3-type subunit I [Planctomycetota bacterium]